MEGFRVRHKLFERGGTRPEFSSEILEKIEKITGRYPRDNRKSALIPVLHIVQGENGGFLTPAAMDFVADLLGIAAVEVYEVATFYTQFYIQPVGKYVIEVCQTGPCAFCGGDEILSNLVSVLGINPGETTDDGMFTLKTVECLGSCGNAPVMQINTNFFENLTPVKLLEIINGLRDDINSNNVSENAWAEQYFLKN